MKVEVGGFKPGYYILALPKQVRNVKTIVTFVYASAGGLCSGITVHLDRSKKKIDWESIKKYGWIVLDYKDAGPHEQQCIRLMTHDDGEMQHSHMSLVEGVVFEDREAFFKLIEDSLVSMIKMRDEIRSGTFSGELLLDL